MGEEILCKATNKATTNSIYQRAELRPLSVSYAEVRFLSFPSLLLSFFLRFLPLMSIHDDGGSSILPTRVLDVSPNFVFHWYSSGFFFYCVSVLNGRYCFREALLF